METAPGAERPATSGFVLDLYAGAGGWDEGAAMLGLPSVGLELAWDPCVTAVRAGHPRVRCDVSRYPTEPFIGRAVGVTGSPPCTTFSAAGHGAGRQVVDILIRGLDEMSAGRATRAARRRDAARVIKAWALARRSKATRAQRAAWANEQAASAVQVLEPLRYIRDLRPGWVCLEQVRAVLPIWRHYAKILRGWGYSAWTGILNSADYGVPQTRERAILIASRERLVAPPDPTHAKVPTVDLFGERARWVSMAEALGWTGTIATGTNSMVSRVGDQVRYERDTERPAPVVVGNTGRWKLRNNTNTNACERDIDEPAGTLFFGGRCNDVSWVLRSPHHAKTSDRTRPRTLDEPAHTIAFGHSDMSWVRQRPATTVLGEERIAAPGRHGDRTGADRHVDSLRITIVEAAVLQSFPADYPWSGNRTSQFLQVGNAVPPRLAAAVIGAAAGLDWQAAVDERYGASASETEAVA